MRRGWWFQVLESVGPGEAAAAVAALAGLCATVVRGRVAQARERRRAMAEVAKAFSAGGGPARVRQEMRGDQWSLDLDRE
ncbi:hypothetical protein [Streptomyces sp. NPDC058308]|uniref:hypothetical protein n=1 Tax=Streptomyces sp. NPDC058308 TaxID=3346440 RepID=UPI0036F06AD0